jgi:hypothetical protein
MKVKEYLEKMSKDIVHVTFIKARARKDAHTPFYHAEYQTTPLFSVFELKELNESSHINDYIILNDQQACITWLSGADWNNEIKNGRAKCLLVVSPQDAKLLAVQEHTEKYIEKQLNI